MEISSRRDKGRSEERSTLYSSLAIRLVRRLKQCKAPFVSNHGTPAFERVGVLIQTNNLSSFVDVVPDALCHLN